MKGDIEYRIFGVCIKTSAAMTVIEHSTVKRTWRERLLTLPWRPLQKEKTVATHVPSREIFQLPDGAFLMHPSLLAEIRRAAGNTTPTWEDGNP